MSITVRRLSSGTNQDKAKTYSIYVGTDELICTSITNASFNQRENSFYGRIAEYRMINQIMQRGVLVID